MRTGSRNPDQTRAAVVASLEASGEGAGGGEVQSTRSDLRAAVLAKEDRSGEVKACAVTVTP